MRDYSALDEIDLKPQQTPQVSIFPEDPTEVVLADVDKIIVMPTATGSWAVATPVAVPDVKVRPSIIASATIQELLCGPLFTGVAAAPASLGPRVTGATFAAQSVTFTTDRPLAAPTLNPQSFSVADYSDTAGWNQIDIGAVARQADGSVVVQLTSAPSGRRVRFIAHGSGPTPLLGTDLVPLGAPGISGADDGIDFVKMFERS